MLLLLLATPQHYFFPNSLLYFGLVQFIAAGSDGPQRGQFGHCAGFTQPIPAMSDTVALAERNQLPDIESQAILFLMFTLKQSGMCESQQLPLPPQYQLRPCILGRFSCCVF